MKIDVAKRAERDLDDIFDDTFDQWGAEQAMHYTTAIRTQMTSLVENAGMLRRQTVDGKPVLRVNAGSHAIWARVVGNRLRVIRILHQRMDPARHL